MLDLNQQLIVLNKSVIGILNGFCFILSEGEVEYDAVQGEGGCFGIGRIIEKSENDAILVVTLFHCNEYNIFVTDVKIEV